MATRSRCSPRVPPLSEITILATVSMRTLSSSDIWSARREKMRPCWLEGSFALAEIRSFIFSLRESR